jgi:hypothetical protein
MYTTMKQKEKEIFEKKYFTEQKMTVLPMHYVEE